MKLLLHTCCAPCSIAVVDALRAEGIEPTAYYFNPNIHPFTEWRMRRNTLVEYAKSIDLALVVDGEYGLRAFLDEVGAVFDARCPKCYRMRLEQTARYAAEHGYKYISAEEYRKIFIREWERKEKKRPLRRMITFSMVRFAPLEISSSMVLVA